MKDKRIWEFKRRAEEDNLITAGACRLILRIASWRYCTKHHPADAEFSLSWRHMAAWYDNEGPEAIKNKRTIYGWIRELVHHRYLYSNGRKGCPPQACYRIDLDYKPEPLWLFDWGAEQAAKIMRRNWRPTVQKTAPMEVQKTAPTIGGKNAPTTVQKTAPPINRYSLREEMYKTPKGRIGGAVAPEDGKKGEEIDARSARQDGGKGRSSSLRSKENSEAQISSASALKSTGSLAGEYLPESESGNASAPDSTSLRCVSPDDANLRMSETKLKNCPEILNDADVERLARAGVKLPKEVAKKFKRVLVPILREKISK